MFSGFREPGAKQLRMARGEVRNENRGYNGGLEAIVRIGDFTLRKLKANGEF